MPALLAEGFSLGLSTGLFCLGACAPLLVPYLLAERRGWGLQTRLLGEFMAGRLLAYVLFGAAAGWLGARLEGAAAWARGPGNLAAGLALLAFALARNMPRPWSCPTSPCGKALARLPFLLGLCVGAAPCPPFLAGMIRLFTLKSAALGAAYFTAFFAGTTLYILPLAATAPLSRLRRLGDIAAITSVLSGLWFVALGLKACI